MKTEGRNLSEYNSVVEATLTPGFFITVVTRN